MFNITTHHPGRGRHRHDPRTGPDGAPFGFGRGFGGRGQRRMIRRGEIRPLILSTLAIRPMHGYEVIQELEAQSGGRWRPSAGSVYPTLQQLTDEGLLTSAGGRRPAHLLAHRRGPGGGERGARASAGTEGDRDGDPTTSATSPARSPRPRCQVQRVGSPNAVDRDPGDPRSTRAPGSTACSPATPAAVDQADEASSPDASDQ